MIHPTFYPPNSDAAEYDQYKNAQRRQRVREGLTNACKALVSGNHITKAEPTLTTRMYTTIRDREGNERKRTFNITIELIAEEHLPTEE